MLKMFLSLGVLLLITTLLADRYLEFIVEKTGFLLIVPLLVGLTAIYLTIVFPKRWNNG